MERSSTESKRMSLYAIQHKDYSGNPITDPDLSNPTRHRYERPLDTIRAFEASAEESFRLRQSVKPGISNGGRNTPGLKRPASAVNYRRNLLVTRRPRSFVTTRNQTSSITGDRHAQITQGRQNNRLHETWQPSNDNRRTPPINGPTRDFALDTEGQCATASKRTNFEDNAIGDRNTAKLPNSTSVRRQPTQPKSVSVSGSPMPADTNELDVDQERAGCPSALEQQTTSSTGATSPIESASDGETSQPTNITTPSSKDQNGQKAPVADSSSDTRPSPTNVTPAELNVTPSTTKPSDQEQVAPEPATVSKKKKRSWFGLTMARSIGKRMSKPVVA